MEEETDQVAAPRQLQRRSSGRVMAGVASGLGDYAGVDPVFFRMGFIVLTLIGGSGLLLYLVGWMLIPEETRERSIGLSLLERIKGRRWLAIVLVTIAGVFLLNSINVGTLQWDVLGAIALVSIGYVLLRDEPVQERPRPDQQTIEMTPGGRAVVAPRPRPARPARVRSPLGFMTLGAAFVAVAFASLLAGSNVVALDPGQFVAIPVITLGLGLVVAAWWGRARLLILLAMFLVPVMVVASMIDVPLRGSISADYTGVTRGNVEGEYELLAGSMTLDFARYRFGDAPTEIDVTFGAGDVEIFVPPGVDVEVNGEVDLGVADLFGEGFKGRNLKFGDTYERKGLTKGSLVINVDGGFGSFDTTWASWVEHNKRLELRREERREQRREERREQRKDRRDARSDGKTRNERAEGKKDGRDRDSK